MLNQIHSLVEFFMGFQKIIKFLKFNKCKSNYKLLKLHNVKDLRNYDSLSLTLECGHF